MDMVSYLLGKKASGGGSYGWTITNADNTKAVFKSLPEEVIVDIDGTYIYIYGARLLKMPVPEDGYITYVGQCHGETYIVSDSTSYIASGRLYITFTEDGVWDDLWFNFAYSKVIDGNLYIEHNEFNDTFESIIIQAYKGKPVDEVALNTFTFRINGVEYEATEGMTWLEWVQSDYNTDGCYYDGSYILNADHYSVYDNFAVSPNGEIVPDNDYYAD